MVYFKKLSIIFFITFILLEIVSKFFEGKLQVYDVWPVTEFNKKKEIVLKKNLKSILKIFQFLLIKID